jgi:hypothetical protein
MPSAQSTFTALERAVLGAICEMHPEDRAALEAQLATATFQSRENDGYGFYTHFVVDRTRTPAIGGMRLRNGPAAARIDGLERGMGFVLWLEGGYADCLEGYPFDESTTEINLETVDFDISPSPCPSNKQEPPESP